MAALTATRRLRTKQIADVCRLGDNCQKYADMEYAQNAKAEDLHELVKNQMIKDDLNTVCMTRWAIFLAGEGTEIKVSPATAACRRTQVRYDASLFAIGELIRGSSL